MKLECRKKKASESWEPLLSLTWTIVESHKDEDLPSIIFKASRTFFSSGRNWPSMIYASALNRSVMPYVPSSRWTSHKIVCHKEADCDLSTCSLCTSFFCHNQKPTLTTIGENVSAESDIFPFAWHVQLFPQSPVNPQTEGQHCVHSLLVSHRGLTHEGDFQLWCLQACCAQTHGCTSGIGPNQAQVSSGLQDFMSNCQYWL